MWGDEKGRAVRFFRINPNNHSGRRLYKWIGHENAQKLYVTNSCRKQVSHSTHHGKPDHNWLQDNLSLLCPTLLLVCGNVAKKTYMKTDVTRMAELEIQTILYLPHPAARLTKVKLLEIEQKVQKAISNLGGK